VVREDPPEVAGLVLTDTWVDYEDVCAALAQVPPRQRTVLRYFEDLSEAETADWGARADGSSAAAHDRTGAEGEGR
jgi:hypothetical protein